ncbi:hypothetical protein [Facklamia miroungae]|uniref:Uncharacterized protein n=1 Tax=Facklamia miroungae TaxID=120956 RepID=A0A1G7QQW6_9LACT|nr:hypothetical protein [Facklamia miroungae]NKZ29006.1 hypothetical protein [Facklamia miroungae]SDG00030.1 hypothetical protein SAMN05421791_102156 [Facklamia miroungae]
MISKIYWFLEVVIIGVGFFLNDYAKKRSGLYRHLYYREFQFTESWFAENMHWLWFGLALLLMTVAFFALIQTKKHIHVSYQLSWKVHWFILAMIGLSMFGILTFLADKKVFIAYPYFLIGLPLLGIGNLMGGLLILGFHPSGQEIKTKTGGM